MTRDFVTQRWNLKDSEVALRAALLELRRVKGEAAQAERTCGRVVELQGLLAHEMQAHTALRQENARLSARNGTLMDVLREALEATGDVEHEAHVNGVAAENSMLWQLVRLSQSASRYACGGGGVLAAGSPGQLPRARGPASSLGGRTRSSSSSTTPSSAWSPDRPHGPPTRGGGGSPGPVMEAHDRVCGELLPALRMPDDDALESLESLEGLGVDELPLHENEDDEADDEDAMRAEPPMARTARNTDNELPAVIDTELSVTDGLSPEIGLPTMVPATSEYWSLLQAASLVEGAILASPPSPPEAWAPPAPVREDQEPPAHAPAAED